MPPLLKKALRDLWASRGPVACVALLTAVVVILVVGGIRCRRMLVASRDTVYERLAHADLELRFAPTPPGVAREALEVDGVAGAEERLLLAGVLDPPAKRPLAALVRVLPATGTPRMERLEPMRGRLPRPDERALAIDRSLAATHGLGVGDEVVLRLRGHAQRLPIVGVFLSPEHVMWPIHPQYALPLRGTVAVVAVSAAAARISQRAPRVDSLLVDLAPGASEPTVRAALRKHLSVSIVDVVAARDRPGHVFTNRILDIFDIYMPTTAAMVVAVALGLLLLTLLRILEGQRVAIGTLRTLGHRSRHVAGAFLVVGLVPTAVGIGLGALTHGYFARVVFDSYAGSIGLPPLVDPGAGRALAATSVACLLVAAAACFLPALWLARRRPVTLLRDRGWDSSGRAEGLLLRAAAATRERLRMPLSVVLGLTHVLRHRGATLVAVLGLGSSFALVTAFLLVHVTHGHEVEAAARRMGLDGTVQFHEAVDEEAIAALARRAHGTAEPILSQRMWIVSEAGAHVWRTLLVPPGRWLGKQRLVAGRRFLRGDTQALLIDRWIARTQHLGVGAVATVYPYRDAPEGSEVEVVGILEGVGVGLAVMPIDTGRDLFDVPGLATGAHVVSGLPPAALEDALWQAPDVEAVFSMQRASAQVRESFRGSADVLLGVLLMAVGVAVLFLGALAWVDAKERAPDFALLTAVGWRGRSIIALCMTEVLTRGLAALALGVALAPLLARVLLARLASTNLPQMTLETPGWVFGVVIGAALALLPLGAVPALRAARRVTPARALRLLARE